MADDYDSMPLDQLEALLAQKQAAAQGPGPSSATTLMPLNQTLSEMKGLTKAGGTGLIKGATDVVGMPGDVQSLGTAAINELPSNYSGVVAALQNVDKSQYFNPKFPTSADLQKKVEGWTGPLYQPQTGAEKIVQAGGEAVPFGLLGAEAPLANMARAGLSGAASEAAGQATEGTPYETLARIIAGMGAYGLGAAAPPTTRIVNTPGREGIQNASRALETNPGVRVPASVISGNRLVATLEGGQAPMEGAVSNAMKRQGGIPVPPGYEGQYRELVEQRRNDLQNQGNALAAQTSIPPVPGVPPMQQPLRQQLANDVARHVGQFGGMTGAGGENPAVQQALNNYDQATMGGQPLTGAQYQRLHQAWNADPDTRPMAQHLDAAMDAAHPGVWDQWRQNWADYEGLRAASESMGGEATAKPLSPDKVVGAMYRTDTPMYRTAENAQTVRAAHPKPYDPTTAVSALGALLGPAAGAAYHGGIVGGSDLGIYGLLAAPPLTAMASGGAGALFRGRAGQNLLRNMDPRMVAALLAQQGIRPKGAPAEQPQGAGQ